MIPPELLLSPLEAPVDPVAILGEALGEGGEAAADALAERALAATLTGGALLLDAGAREALGDGAAKLLAAGILAEVGARLVIPRHDLRLALAARAVAGRDPLPEEIVGQWLDRGFEGFASQLCAELARRGDLTRCGDVIHWIAGQEAPAEEELLTAGLTAAAAIHAAALAHGADLPEEVFEVPLGELIQRWRPELPLATWVAMTRAVGSLAALPHAPGPHMRQVLEEFFVHISSLAAGGDDEEDATAWLWHLQQQLLEAALESAAADPAPLEVALTQLGGPVRAARALIAAQLEAQARSPEVARRLDEIAGRARELDLAGPWLRARALAGDGDSPREAALAALKGGAEDVDDGAAAAAEAVAALHSLGAPEGEIRQRILARAAALPAEAALAAAQLLAAHGGIADAEAEPLVAALSGGGAGRLPAALALTALARSEQEAGPLLLAQLSAWLDDRDAPPETGPVILEALAERAISSALTRRLLLRSLDAPDLRVASVLALDSACERLWVYEDDRPWAREATAPWRAEVVAACLRLIGEAAGPVRRLLGRIAGWSARGGPEEVAVTLTHLVAAADAGELAHLLVPLGAAQIPAEAVIHRLVRAMDHDDLEVLVAACRGAGYLVDGWLPDATLLEGWPELFDALRACVAVGDQAVSEAAARALWRLSRQRVPEEEIDD